MIRGDSADEARFHCGLGIPLNGGDGLRCMPTQRITDVFHARVPLLIPDGLLCHAARRLLWS